MLKGVIFGSVFATCSIFSTFCAVDGIRLFRDEVITRALVGFLNSKCRVLLRRLAWHGPCLVTMRLNPNGVDFNSVIYFLPKSELMLKLNLYLIVCEPVEFCFHGSYGFRPPSKL